MKKNLIINTVALIGLMVVYSSSSFAANERQTFTAWNSQRGTTVNIPESTIKHLCGDWDGCTLRMGMYNWAGNGRTASRGSLFYYNNWTKTWRAERSDKSGKNNDNVTQHVMNAWACYFTDGEYRSWFNRGDFDLNFGLLSWNQYNATCKLTIID